MMKNRPVINNEKTAENIKRLIRKRHLFINALQIAFGFTTPVAIYKWLRGVSLPSIDNLVILSRILKVSIDDILIVDDIKIE